MATQQFTRTNNESTFPPIALPTQEDERPLMIRIRPSHLDFWEYEGTRAQIEGENVISRNVEWPDGLTMKSFTSDGFEYRLFRKRPEKKKGTAKTCGYDDCWRLQCWLTSGPSREEQLVLEKKRELAAAIYAQTPAGRRESRVNHERHWNAVRDRAFQEFKNKLLPARKKPGSKPKAEATYGLDKGGLQ